MQEYRISKTGKQDHIISNTDKWVSRISYTGKWDLRIFEKETMTIVLEYFQYRHAGLKIPVKNT